MRIITLTMIRQAPCIGKLPIVWYSTPRVLYEVVQPPTTVLFSFKKPTNHLPHSDLANSLKYMATSQTTQSEKWRGVFKVNTKYNTKTRGSYSGRKA